MKIEIHHGIYDSDFGTFKYRNSNNDMCLPNPIKFFIRKRHKKWSKKFVWKRLCEFSVAHTSNYPHYWAITMVHPLDHFNRKIGAAIVKGRVLRAITRGYPVDETPSGLFCYSINPEEII